MHRTMWSLKPKIVHYIYTRLVVLIYACMVKKANAIDINAKLNKIHRLSCLAITSAMQTPHTISMEVHSGSISSRYNNTERHENGITIARYATDENLTKGLYILVQCQTKTRDLSPVKETCNSNRDLHNLGMCKRKQ